MKAFAVFGPKPLIIVIGENNVMSERDIAMIL